MRVRLPLVTVTAVVLALGCVTSGPTPRFGREAWRAGITERRITSPRLIYPFETSPALEAWAESAVVGSPETSDVSRLRRLQQAVFDPDSPGFAYDDTRTLTAAEAFRERRGNCLSFTMMFVAAARSLGIEAFLVSVQRPPEVETSGDLVIVNRHVVAGHRADGRLHLFDFSQSSPVPYFRHQVVDDIGATAMYHNNVGGAAIRAGDLPVAVEHLELAVELDSELVPAWVNLGVAHQRLQRPHRALGAYERALRLEPGHPSALTNAAYVYRQLGLEAQARAALEAATKRRSTPFTLIALADMEMTRGELETARRYLRRARRLASDQPSVYEALARLASRLGDHRRADSLRRRAEHIRKQLENATPRTASDDGR